jgi:hypothetical protein
LPDGVQSIIFRYVHELKWRAVMRDLIYEFTSLYVHELKWWEVMASLRQERTSLCWFSDMERGIDVIGWCDLDHAEIREGYYTCDCGEWFCGEGVIGFC